MDETFLESRLRAAMPYSIQASCKLVQVVEQPKPNCLGDVSVMQDDKGYLILRNLPSFRLFGQEPHKRNELAKLYNLLGQRPENVQPFLGFDTASDQEQLKGVFGYHPTTLSLLLNCQRDLKKPLPEQAIWTVLRDISKAGLHLQHLGLWSNSISLDSVYHDGKGFNLVHPFMSEETIAAWLAAQENLQETLKLKWNDGVVQLGYTVLQLCALQTDEELYRQGESAKKSVQKEKARQAIQVMSSVYGTELNTVVLSMIKGRTTTGLMSFEDLKGLNPALASTSPKSIRPIFNLEQPSGPKLEQEPEGLIDIMKNVFNKSSHVPEHVPRITEVGNPSSTSKSPVESRHPQGFRGDHTASKTSKLSELIAAAEPQLSLLHTKDAGSPLEVGGNHPAYQTAAQDLSAYPESRIIVPNGPRGPVKITATNLSLNNTRYQATGGVSRGVKATLLDTTLRPPVTEGSYLGSPQRQLFDSKNLGPGFDTQVSRVVPSYIPTLDEVKQQQDEEDHINGSRSLEQVNMLQGDWESQLAPPRSKNPLHERSFRQPANISRHGDVEVGQHVYRPGFRNDIKLEAQQASKLIKEAQEEHHISNQDLHATSQLSRPVLSEVLRGEKVYIPSLTTNQPILLDLSRQETQNRGRSVDPRLNQTGDGKLNYTKVNIFDDQQDGEFGGDISQILKKPVPLKRSGSLAGLILQDLASSPNRATQQQSATQFRPPAADSAMLSGPRGIVSRPTMPVNVQMAGRPSDGWTGQRILPTQVMYTPVSAVPIVGLRHLQPVNKAPALVYGPVLARDSVRPLAREAWSDTYHPLRVVQSVPMRALAPFKGMG